MMAETRCCALHGLARRIRRLGGIAEHLDGEAGSLLDIARVDDPTTGGIARPDTSHAIGHQFQLDAIDLIPWVGEEVRVSPMPDWT